MAEQALQRILYVEDDPDIRRVTRIALERLGGFTVQTCESGAEALEAAAGFQPDMVLLDVMMPDMDGTATMEALRKLPGLGALPVVFITAKTRREELEHLQGLGALGVITKPFDPTTIADTLRELWAGRG